MSTFLKKRLLLPLLFVGITLGALVGGCGKEEQIKVSDTRFSMDTFVKIDAYSDKPGEARLAVDDAMQTFQKIAAATDRYSDGGPGSLYEANLKAASAPVQVAPQLASLLGYLQQKPDQQLDISIAPVVDLWQLARSQTALPSQTKMDEALRHVGREKYSFDPASKTLRYSDPATRLDLGAVAKGYAVDAAAATLKKHSAVTCALVNAGGNIKAVGNKPGNMPWRVAVQHPRDPEAFLGTVMLTDGQAAATSGDYQRYYEVDGIRYHHLLDAQTGQPSRLHQSVTVIAESALDADYYSTLFFLLPTPGINAHLANNASLNVVVVENDGSIFISEGLSKTWQPAKGV
ncbi:FAD:protein FMN transferase [Phascolarctobacterium sp.]|uniref:FAD:protein FMN transferase n=1 Tax=Phascolarctobacterium sp. TaxID=2049039 RepID=UPI0025F01BD6|nr:FAD:protein FMN transferase [uncultured Phascolarctobacterium sp.]